MGDNKGPGLNDISRRQTNAASAPLLRYLWPHRLNDLPSNPPDQEDVAFRTVQPTDRRHENCFEIAYTGSSVGDQVNGPIHTNDYWFWYCGNPEFNDVVESTGDPNTLLPTIDRVFKLTTNAGCTGGLPENVCSLDSSQGPNRQLSEVARETDNVRDTSEQDPQPDRR